MGWSDYCYINFNLKDLVSHIHNPGPYLKSSGFKNTFTVLKKFEKLCNKQYLRFEVFTAATIKNVVFCDVALCRYYVN
jgi:hypothetical protein